MLFPNEQLSCNRFSDDVDDLSRHDMHGDGRSGGRNFKEMNDQA